MIRRWVALAVVLVATLAANGERAKRQVTYHADGPFDSAENEDSQSILPATKKPLPLRVLYPGDLSSFYTTDKPNSLKSNNFSSATSQGGIIHRRNRRKRSEYLRRRAQDSKRNGNSPSRSGKSSRNRDVLPMESRLHSSYHKPSVSIMNDFPVEMSFNGAGFLRHEDDDFDYEKDSRSNRNSAPRSAKASQSKNRDLDDFRKVFNVSRERVPSQVKFDDDDDTSYQSEAPPFQASEGNVPDYGTQGAENGTPLAVDYMAAYQNAFQNQFQNGMFGNPQFNYAQTQPTQTPQTQPFDPYSFNFPNMFGGQSNTNQMIPQGMQQHDSFMQNHRIPQMSNPSGIPSPTMYSSIPQQQNFATNPMFAHPPTPNPQQQNHKTQRRKRSIPALPNGEGDTISSASHLTQNNYRYAQVDDQQGEGQQFIPIAGNFNGGTIQFNIPFYGQNPIIQPGYPPRPPIHGSYSMPGRPEGRHYGGSGERFYHPSEARRYSYGVLGSGNFEVIRGGLFPGERQQSYRGGGYQDGRTPSYGGDDWNGNNYGTTEIIIDGPIQGFQGFDNFQLINALSKHSEVAVRPDRRDSEEHSL